MSSHNCRIPREVFIGMEWDEVRKSSIPALIAKGVPVKSLNSESEKVANAIIKARYGDQFANGKKMR